MHVKRGDLIALKACALVTSVVLVQSAGLDRARAFRVDQESACDADVLRRTSISASHLWRNTAYKPFAG